METPCEPITVEDFARLDVRAGTILEAAPLPDARKPALLLSIDFGPDLGVRKSSARIHELYAPGALLGQQVLAVVNLPPRQVGKRMSACLVLGFPAEDGRVVLAVPERAVPDGARMY